MFKIRRMKSPLCQSLRAAGVGRRLAVLGCHRLILPIHRDEHGREGEVYDRVILRAVSMCRLDCSVYLILLASISCRISLARFRPAAISLVESLAVMLAKIVRATSLVSAASVKYAKASVSFLSTPLPLR